MPPKAKAKKRQLSVRLEEELSSLTPDEIRSQLLAMGEEIGPVNVANKDMYIRMLVRKKQKLDTPSSTTFSPVSHPRDSPKLVLNRKPLNSDPPKSKPLTRTAGISAPATPDQVGTSASVSAAANSLSASKRKAYQRSTTKSQKSDLQTIRNFKIDGLTAATYTPFNEQGELNLSMIDQYAEWLLSCGVNNVFLNGSTGESLSLTVEERKSVTEEWIRVAGKRLTIIVHVGTENLKYTSELAKHAQEVGAAAIGVMPTTFFKPQTIDLLILYLQKVADSAPKLPMYYYNIPSMTGVNFPMEDFLEKANSQLPTLRGLKYTSMDLFEFGRCVVSDAEKYQIVYGCDQQVIGALALGGTAAIGSTYNYAGKLFNRLFSAFKRNQTETAKLEQRRSQAMIKLYQKYGGHPGSGKAIMKMCGVDCGPPRLPYLPLPSDSARGLESDLRDIGFFEWS